MSSQRGLGRSVFRGCKRRVQGSNGLNSAQLSRPRGSTQTIPSRHDGAQRPRRDAHAVIKAWGTAHVPMVVSWEGGIRPPIEKGQQTQRSFKLTSSKHRTQPQLTTGMGSTICTTREKQCYTQRDAEGDLVKTAESELQKSWNTEGTNTRKDSEIQQTRDQGVNKLSVNYLRNSVGRSAKELLKCPRVDGTLPLERIQHGMQRELKL